MFLVLLFLLMIFLAGFSLCIPWLTHRDMVMKNPDIKTYGYADYDKFVKYFDKVVWSHEKMFPESLFDYLGGNKFHASIIQFDGIGMVMKSPFDFMKARAHVKSYIKEHFPNLRTKNTTYRWE